MPYAQKPSYATFSSVRNAAIKSHFDLWDASIGELTSLLQQRINRFEQQRLIVFVISGLIIASVVYLLFGFYRAVMNTIGGFQPAAQAMLEGKELQTVNVATRDELGRVAVSFNAIASAMIESSQQRQAIIDHAADAIMLVDQTGMVRDANLRCDAMFAMPVVGQSLFDLTTISQQQLEQRTIMEEGTARRHDGTEFPIETSIGSMQEGDEELWIVFVRDISARRTTELERNRLQMEMLRGQEAMLQRLSAPLIPLTNEVVVMPLVGTLSGERLASINNLVPRDIERLRARIVILDLTGVPSVDAAVVPQFGLLAQAIRLLGARLILTGIQPDVADALVQAGINLSAIQTYSTLQNGIRAVLR